METNPLRSHRFFYNPKSISVLLFTILYWIWIRFGDVPFIKTSSRLENFDESALGYFMGILVLVSIFIASRLFRSYAKDSKSGSYRLFNSGIIWGPAFVFGSTLLEITTGVERRGTMADYLFVFPSFLLALSGSAIANRPWVEKPFLLIGVIIGIISQYFILIVFVIMISGFKGIRN